MCVCVFGTNGTRMQRDIYFMFFYFFEFLYFLCFCILHFLYFMFFCILYFFLSAPAHPYDDARSAMFGA